MVKAPYDPTDYRTLLRNFYLDRIDSSLFNVLEERINFAANRPQANKVLCAAECMANDIQYGDLDDKLESEPTTTGMIVARYMHSVNESNTKKVPIYYTGNYSNAREAILGIQLEAAMTNPEFSKYTGISRKAMRDLNKAHKYAIQTSHIEKVLAAFEFYPADASQRLRDLPRN